MYRYRTTASTRNALKRFEKHHHKIGYVVRIKGYSWLSKYKDSEGETRSKINTGILIVGTTGTMRIEGFAWGYAGEGPRGLKVILENLNVPADAIVKILATDWNGWGKVEEAWSYTFGQPILAKVA
jgi:hypothetical protein